MNRQLNLGDLAKKIQAIEAAIAEADESEDEAAYWPEENLQHLEAAVNRIVDAVKRGGSPPWLRETIISISEACFRQWEQRYRAKAEELAAAISKAAPTPVLSISGWGTDEVTFTEYLVYYLDPTKFHGLGDRFLRAVLEPEVSFLGDDWTRHCSVKSEVSLGSTATEEGYHIGGRIDLVVSGDDFAFFVEHKVLSSPDHDQESGLRQLGRYSRLLAENWSIDDFRTVKLLLSPSGRSPQAEGWRGISHVELVRRGLPLLEDPSISERAKENLRSLLIDLYIGPYERTVGVLREVEKLAESVSDASEYKRDMREFEALLNVRPELIGVLTLGRD